MTTLLGTGNRGPAPASAMTTASGSSPILAETTGNELDFYLAVKRYNFSMQSALYSPYYHHCKFRWRLVVYPRTHSSGVSISIECGGPDDKKKSPWSCSARLFVSLVHPKRWPSIGISFPIQDGELSKIIPRSQPASETSAAAEPHLDADAPADAVSAPEPPSTVPITAADLDSSKKTESGPVKLPEAAAAAEPAPPTHENQPSSKESPATAAGQSLKTSKAGPATPSEPLSAIGTQPPAEDSPQSVAEETSDPLLVQPSKSDAQEKNEPEADSEAPEPASVKHEEKEYIPQDLIITQSHTYSSTEFSYSYDEEEFAPFALLQPGMFCDEEMNIVIRVKILANDFYNANRGNAGSGAGSVYGSSNTPSLVIPPPVLTPMLTSSRSSFVPSSIPAPEPLSLDLTCRRALVQQIVDMDKIIAGVSSDVAADVLKKEIEVLNEGLEQLSSATQGAKKDEKNIKGAFVALLKRRKPTNERVHN